MSCHAYSPQNLELTGKRDLELTGKRDLELTWSAATNRLAQQPTG